MYHLDKFIYILYKIKCIDTFRYFYKGFINFSKFIIVLQAKILAAFERYPKENTKRKNSIVHKN